MITRFSGMKDDELEAIARVSFNEMVREMAKEIIRLRAMVYEQARQAGLGR